MWRKRKQNKKEKRGKKINVFRSKSIANNQLRHLISKNMKCKSLLAATNNGNSTKKKNEKSKYQSIDCFTYLRKFTMRNA